MLPKVISIVLTAIGVRFLEPSFLIKMLLNDIGVKNKYILLYGNLSTPVNTVVEQYFHRGWILTM